MSGSKILLLFAAVVLSVATGSCSRQAAEPVERKVMIIGIDGMEWDIMGPLIEQGRLPNFARLMSEGAWGELRSLDILESPVIWTSIATGKVPEKHGIMGFAKRPREGAEPVPMTSNVRRVEAIWNMIGYAGKSVGVVGWLATWPAEPVNGYMVTDYFNYGWDPGREGDRDRLSFPPSLATDLAGLRVLAGEVPDEQAARLIRGDVPTNGNLRVRFDGLKGAIATDQTTRAVADRLWNQMPVDLFAVYMKGVDGVCHLYWVDMIPGSGPPVSDAETEMFGEVIPRYYEEMDLALADFIDKADENTTVILTSDHGHSGPKRYGDSYRMGIAMHDPTGVLVLWGKDIEGGVKMSEPSVLDITPTILALWGMPVADDMDGRVLIEAIDPAFLREHAIGRIATYEPEAGSSDADGHEPIESSLDEEVREQLRALGYID
ncbi:MAG: alkaline phosphatase family protein [Candidatus Eisenbacteria bacterium]|nr:alkaline phosphatase family protein [Candidatus Eisenbacteria bacterium]